MSQAGMMARLGLDTSDYDRGIDGAVRKTEDFSVSMRQIRQSIHAAFAASALYGFMQMFKDVQEAGKQGIKLVSDEDLRVIEDAAASIHGIKLDIEATAVTWTSRIIGGLQAGAAWLGTWSEQVKKTQIGLSDILHPSQLGGKWEATKELFGAGAEEERAQAMGNAAKEARQKADQAEVTKLTKEIAEARAKMHVKEEGPQARLGEVRKEWVQLTAQLDSDSKKGLLTEKERLEIEKKRTDLLKEDDELVVKIGVSFTKHAKEAEATEKKREEDKKKARHEQLASMKSSGRLELAQAELDATLGGRGGEAGKLKQQMRIRAKEWEQARKEESALRGGKSFEEIEAHKAAQVRVLETRKGMVESEQALRGFYEKENQKIDEVHKRAAQKRDDLSDPRLHSLAALRSGGLSSIGGYMQSAQAMKFYAQSGRGHFEVEMLRINKEEARDIEQIKGYMKAVASGEGMEG